jgi:hypothetical protein
MLVKFDHSINISMPDVCTSHYQLLKDFTKFLSHIHGLNAFKDDLQATLFSVIIGCPYVRNSPEKNN